MFFVATAQPKMPETEDPNYKGPWLTIEEKRELIRNHDKNNNNLLPLCIDHAGGDEINFEVPYNKRMGCVKNIFMDKDGHLGIKGEVFMDSSEFGTVIKGILEHKEKWGVSAWTDLKIYPDGKIEKNITHVGITLDPALANEGSFIHEFGPSESKINDIIKEKYYKENLGHCFASKNSIEKWNNNDSGVGDYNKEKGILLSSI